MAKAEHVPQAPEAQNFSQRDFRAAMGQFASGVVVISTGRDAEIHAMTANAFMSGSLAPVLVLVSVAKTARMHGRIVSTRQYGVSVLSQSQQWVSNHFAGKAVPDRVPAFDQLADIPVVHGAMVRLAADLAHEYDCGDHTLFVGEVRALELHHDHQKPLLYYGGSYRNVAPPDWSVESVPEILWQDQGFSY
ncbi:flavin reductase family protein [Nitratireductor alexandrii]|uniref:flavin reductase family protein n=1 Tax=Nitratireductor alexandrii TaxID=2448161 RepID=UPI001EE8177D|nr:flavin reductase family protein [Nitratireductor alexandrii]